MRLKPLDEQVVVVFGASRGIGRETARRFARRGARVVAAARDREGLESLANEIRAEGGEVTILPAEAADSGQVKAVADAAAGAYGHLDTWVQVAAVTLYAPFDATTPDEFRRVVDVNLTGSAYGAMAALPHLKAEGRGALIFVSSVEGKYALPLQSAYSASKHGVEGMAKALRLELQREGLPISVTTILPSSVDTPLFDVARTKLGVKPQGFPPVYRPHLVADAILHAATHPEREIVVGGAGKALAVLNRVSPRLADAAVARKAYRLQRTRHVRSVDAPDNLYEPVLGHDRVQGSYAGRTWPFSIYTWLRLRPGIGYTLGALFLVGTTLAVAGPAAMAMRARALVGPLIAAVPVRRRRPTAIVGRATGIVAAAQRAARGVVVRSPLGRVSWLPEGWTGRRRREGRRPAKRIGDAMGALRQGLSGLLPAALIGAMPWVASWASAHPRTERGRRRG